MNDIAWFIFALVVVFLFYGDPDVWDKLHERAMSVNDPVQCYVAPK